MPLVRLYMGSSFLLEAEVQSLVALPFCLLYQDGTLDFALTLAHAVFLTERQKKVGYAGNSSFFALHDACRDEDRDLETWEYYAVLIDFRAEVETLQVGKPRRVIERDAFWMKETEPRREELKPHQVQAKRIADSFFRALEVPGFASPEALDLAYWMIKKACKDREDGIVAYYLDWLYDLEVSLKGAKTDA